MKPTSLPRSHPMIPFLLLALLAGLAWWVKQDMGGKDDVSPGALTFSLGFTLLLAYVLAESLQRFRLPMVSGYILAGILVGPYAGGLLGTAMVRELRLVDDLALSIIALTAGGTLQKQFFRQRGRALALNVVLQSLVVFGLIFGFIRLAGEWFAFTLALDSIRLTVLACLLGVIGIARSPSSAIAIIDECGSKGPFTETVLGVTVVLDVVIIMVFTLALTLAERWLAGAPSTQLLPFAILCLELGGSLTLGVVLGKGLSLYIQRVGRDLPLLLLLFAFGVSRVTLWLNTFMHGELGLGFQLEPLLICMSAGFTVQNLGTAGPAMMETLERISLPVYVVFFSLAGASLDMHALKLTWPLAFCLVGVRSAGLAAAAWLAGTINADPPPHRRLAWMAYITQAGVSIGLAHIAERHIPQLGIHLNTLVLAVIAINQIVGPVTFKTALLRVGEARRG